MGLFCIDHTTQITSVVLRRESLIYCSLHTFILWDACSILYKILNSILLRYRVRKEKNIDIFVQYDKSYKVFRVNLENQQILIPVSDFCKA